MWIEMQALSLSLSCSSWWMIDQSTHTKPLAHQMAMKRQSWIGMFQLLLLLLASSCLASLYLSIVNWVEARHQSLTLSIIQIVTHCTVNDYHWLFTPLVNLYACLFSSLIRLSGQQMHQSNTDIREVHHSHLHERLDEREKLLHSHMNKGNLWLNAAREMQHTERERESKSPSLSVNSTVRADDWVDWEVRIERNKMTTESIREWQREKKKRKNWTQWSLLV